MNIPALLKKEDEPGAVPCSDALLARFLDGLIVYYRGRDESQPPRPVEQRITNNLVLKKLFKKLRRKALKSVYWV